MINTFISAILCAAASAIDLGAQDNQLGAEFLSTKVRKINEEKELPVASLVEGAKAIVVVNVASK